MDNINKIVLAIDEAVSALVYIAGESSHDHKLLVKSSFWLKNETHEDCADMVAMDTKIARQALKKIRRLLNE
jgi:hypothetical protein